MTYPRKNREENQANFLLFKSTVSFYNFGLFQSFSPTY